MKEVAQQVIEANGRKLAVTIANYQGESDLKEVLALVEKCFMVISPFLKDKLQTIYIRDIPYLAIDGQYPGGNCYNRHEVMIAVPKWPHDMKQLKAAIIHEFHHLVRWQNGGYGESLGEAIASEGLACFFETKISGWKAPWVIKELPDLKTLKIIASEWNNKQYNHAEWFFDGKFGKWVGYTTGYHLAETLLVDAVNLDHTFTMSADDIKKVLLDKL